MGTKRSVTDAQHRFSEIPHANIQRSKFDRSCGLKSAFDAGFLVPIFCDEALPGDTMSLSMSLFARLATPIHPIMDNVYLDTHFFAVPIRLIWSNWEKFNGSQVDPGDSTDFLIPEIPVSAGGYLIGSLGDYLGLPTGVGSHSHSNLWGRAYNLIFNEWYRDENLVDSVVVDLDDGPDSQTDYVLLRRGKRHDYFTSCLPFPQKGTAVTLPLGSSAVVTLDSPNIFAPVGDSSSIPKWKAGGAGSEEFIEGVSGTKTAQFNSNTDGGAMHWSNPQLEVDIGGATGIADLSSATASTINQIREAFQIQKLYERDARGGTRYTEIIRSHFGVTSPDARLQRPEFLGGGTTTLGIHAVPQSTQSLSTGVSPQGNLAGYGIAQSTRGGFHKSFTEHCVIIGLVSARADLNYQQGTHRMFSRSTRWDFYWPALAHIGEQAVLNKEIYRVGQPTDDNVFGYQERFAEYRYKPSQITGILRSTAAGSIDTWHLAQQFTSTPVLNQAFIEENPPIDRVIAVPTEPHFIMDAFFSYSCARPMPTYSVPGMIDHF